MNGREHFRQSLVEPGWQRVSAVPEDQVRIFVRGSLRALLAQYANYNEVPIGVVAVISSGKRIETVGLVLLRRTENNDGNWRRLLGRRPGELREEAADTLEVVDERLGIAIARRRVNVEILVLHFLPGRLTRQGN